MENEKDQLIKDILDINIVFQDMENFDLKTEIARDSFKVCLNKLKKEEEDLEDYFNSFPEDKI